MLLRPTCRPTNGTCSSLTRAVRSAGLKAKGIEFVSGRRMNVGRMLTAILQRQYLDHVQRVRGDDAIFPACREQAGHRIRKMARHEGLLLWRGRGLDREDKKVSGTEGPVAAGVVTAHRADSVLAEYKRNSETKILVRYYSKETGYDKNPQSVMLGFDDSCTFKITRQQMDTALDALAKIGPVRCCKGSQLEGAFAGDVRQPLPHAKTGLPDSWMEPGCPAEPVPCGGSGRQGRPRRG